MLYQKPKKIRFQNRVFDVGRIGQALVTMNNDCWRFSVAADDDDDDNEYADSDDDDNDDDDRDDVIGEMLEGAFKVFRDSVKTVGEVVHNMVGNSQSGLYFYPSLFYVWQSDFGVYLGADVLMGGSCDILGSNFNNWMQSVNYKTLDHFL